MEYDLVVMMAKGDDDESVVHESSVLTSIEVLIVGSSVKDDIIVVSRGDRDVVVRQKGEGDVVIV